MVRGAVATAVSAALSGCAGSTTPLVPAADARAPRFADGVWAVTGAGCDLARARTAWPECALRIDVVGDRLRGRVRGALEARGAGPSSTREGPDEMRYLLASGDPVIVQLEDLATPEPARSQGRPARAPQPPSQTDATAEPRFQYYAVRPTRSTGEGLVTRADVWPVVCPEKGAEGFESAGLGCTVRSLDALRREAAEPTALFGWTLTWIGETADVTATP
jgi:hypothetical protein